MNSDWPFISNLLSGFIGAIIGAIIGALGALWVYRIQKIDSATIELLELVYRIGYQSWYYPDVARPGMIFQRFHVRLWSKYTSLKKHIWFWKRARLENVWREYIGRQYYDEIPDDLMGKSFGQGIPGSREEAVKRSENFMRHLQLLLKSKA